MWPTMIPLAVCEEGKGGKCISYWGTRGKRWGSGNSIGGWVMKRKDIGWLLGDKGEGGYMFASICINSLTPMAADLRPLFFRAS